MASEHVPSSSLLEGGVPNFDSAATAAACGTSGDWAMDPPNVSTATSGGANTGATAAAAAASDSSNSTAATCIAAPVDTAGGAAENRVNLPSPSPTLISSEDCADISAPKAGNGPTPSIGGEGCQSMANKSDGQITSAPENASTAAEGCTASASSVATVASGEERQAIDTTAGHLAVATAGARDDCDSAPQAAAVPTATVSPPASSPTDTESASAPTASASTPTDTESASAPTATGSASTRADAESASAPTATGSASAPADSESASAPTTTGSASADSESAPAPADAESASAPTATGPASDLSVAGSAAIPAANESAAVPTATESATAPAATGTSTAPTAATAPAAPGSAASSPASKCAAAPDATGSNAAPSTTGSTTASSEPAASAAGPTPAPLVTTGSPPATPVTGSPPSLAATVSAAAASAAAARSSPGPPNLSSTNSTSVRAPKHKPKAKSAAAIAASHIAANAPLPSGGASTLGIGGADSGPLNKGKRLGGIFSPPRSSNIVAPVSGGRGSDLPPSAFPSNERSFAPAATNPKQHAGGMYPSKRSPNPPAAARHAPLGSPAGNKNASGVAAEPLHPLQSTWCLWVMVDRGASGEWHEKMKEAHEFSTVESFWCMHHNMHGPSALGIGDYYLFRKGVKPDWNDNVFQNGGGRVLVQFPSRSNKLDEIWLNVTLLLIGEGYDDTPDSANSVCGAVAACRSKLTKIALWIATCDLNKVQEVGQRFVDFVASLAGNACDIKPEFESFRKGPGVELVLQGEKQVAPWSELCKKVAKGQYRV